MTFLLVKILSGSSLPAELCPKHLKKHKSSLQSAFDMPLRSHPILLPPPMQWAFQIPNFLASFEQQAH